MCGRWEELVSQQFSALRAGDTAGLSRITATQTRLAEQFARLQGRWSQVNDSEESSPSAELLRARREFVAVVNRMHGINTRNAKALLTMIVLADAYGSAGTLYGGTYTRAGGLTARQASVSKHLNREG